MPIQLSDKQKLFVQYNGKFLFFGGARGGGKAQALDSQVLTPFGFIRMGDVKVGTMVNNPDGSVSSVIAIHPRGELDVYKIKFSDGAETECSFDHLWNVWINNKSVKRNGEVTRDYSVMTTGMIIDRLKKQTKTNYYPCIPLTAPVRFNVSCKNEKIDPYLLGVLIGDGCITSENISFASVDDFIIEKIRNISKKYGATIKVRPDNNCSIRFLNSKKIVELLSSIKLLGKYSHNKFIPRQHLFGSLSDRIELVQGLMDTDGYVDSRGHMSYTTVSKQLAKDFRFLVMSLGAKATITKSEAGYKKENGEFVECKDAYTIYFNSNNNDIFCSLPRKKERLSVYNGGYTLHRQIVSIEYSRKAECQCITVSNPNGLYITDDFIVTHNSAVTVYDAAFHVRKAVSDAFGKIKSVKVSIDYPHYRALLMRRTHPQMKALKDECDKQYIPVGAKYNETKKEYRFPSGAVVMLGSCKNPADVSNYLGWGLHYFGIDEANLFTEEMVSKLESSVRSTDPELKTLIRYSANPGGIGHTWLKRRFVDPCAPIKAGNVFSKEYNIEYPKLIPGEKFYDDEGQEYWYLPSLVFDNKHIIDNDKSYVLFLKNLPPALKEMWLFGNFDSFNGAFLYNWNELVHVIPSHSWVYGLQANDYRLQIDRTTHNFYLGLDYGTSANFVCNIFAIDTNGWITQFDEIVEKNLTAKQQARLITEVLLNKYNLDVTKDIELAIADPSYWNKTQQSKDGETLKSVAEEYLEAGIPLVPGNNDRKQTASLFREALNVDDNGNSKLRFTDNCKYAIETLPFLPCKESDPEDVDTDGEDHSFDATKYFLSRRFYQKEIIRSKERSWKDELREMKQNKSKNWMAR